MRYLVIPIGILLNVLSVEFHREAIRLSDEAISAPLAVDAPLPKGRADLFFGEEPIEFAQRPENQAKIKRSFRFEDGAIYSRRIGIALCVIGLLVLCRRYPPGSPPVHADVPLVDPPTTKCETESKPCGSVVCC